MDQPTEQALQAWLDEATDAPSPATSAEAQADLLAYQALFGQLRVAPTVGLPHGFARRLRRQVEQQAHRRSDVRFHFLSIGLFLVAALGGYGLLFLVDAESARQTKLLVTHYSGALLMAVSLFVGLQLLNLETLNRLFRSNSSV